MAIELERVHAHCFTKKFFDKMTEMNYERFIEQEKYVFPKFADDMLK